MAPALAAAAPDVTVLERESMCGFLDDLFASSAPAFIFASSAAFFAAFFAFYFAVSVAFAAIEQSPALVSLLN